MHDLTQENFPNLIESMIQSEESKLIYQNQVEYLCMQIFCRLCKAKFASRDDYQAHFNTSHQDKLDFAKEKNVLSELFSLNIGYARGPDFPEIEANDYGSCSVCQASWKGRSGFQKHLKNYHQTDEIFTCKRCKKSFSTKIAYCKYF